MLVREIGNEYRSGWLVCVLVLIIVIYSKNMCTTEVSCLLFFSTYFEENNLLHCHDTPQKNDFHTYAVQSEIGKKTIRYKGSKLWNNLSDDLKNTISLPGLPMASYATDLVAMRCSRTAVCVCPFAFGSSSSYTVSDEPFPDRSRPMSC